MYFDLEAFWRQPTPEEARRKELEFEYRRNQEALEKLGAKRMVLSAAWKPPSSSEPAAD